MKKIAVLLSLFVLVGAGVASGTAEQDLIGIFADAEATATSLTANQGDVVDVYLVIVRPSAPSGLHGWECNVSATDNLRLLDWSLEGQALNLTAAPRFMVGLGTALPPAESVVLARGRYLVTDEKPGRLVVRPHTTSSVSPPAPAYAAGDLDAEQPLHRLASADGDRVDAALLVNPKGETSPAIGRNHLHANEPNPFNPATEIRFALAQPGHVRLAVYGLDGRRVATLVDETRDRGSHVAVWNGRDDGGAAVASGVYHYRLEAPGFAATRRMVLLK